MRLTSGSKAVGIDEFYVKAGLKGRELDGIYNMRRARDLSMRECGTYAKDKSPVFVLADRGSGERYASQ